MIFAAGTGNPFFTTENTGSGPRRGARNSGCCVGRGRSLALFWSKLTELSNTHTSMHRHISHITSGERERTRTVCSTRLTTKAFPLPHDNVNHTFGGHSMKREPERISRIIKATPWKLQMTRIHATAKAFWVSCDQKITEKYFPLNKTGPSKEVNLRCRRWRAFSSIFKLEEFYGNKLLSDASNSESRRDISLLKS